MKYIQPKIKMNEAQAAQMLAVSLPVSDETVDGSKALTKEANDWNIWEED